MFGLALAIVCLQLAQLLFSLYGQSRIRPLPSLAMDGNSQKSTHRPVVSILIPARNEEEHLREALATVLRIRDPDVEFVAIDDRSTDATPQILKDAQREEPRLHVVRVEVLPEGWLGKNHALSLGAKVSRGEWLLFTDADVQFTPSALEQAVDYAESQRLDHLAMVPEIRSPSLWVNLFVVLFCKAFYLYFQPWKARDPRSQRFIGIGAFNLVRRTAYEAVGGHQPIRFRPDDDLMLGKRLKSHGFAQECVTSDGAIRLSWYTSLSQAAGGLEKNVLAGCGYRTWVFVLGWLLLVLQEILPWSLVAAGDGWTRWLAAGSLAIGFLHFGFFVRQARFPLWMTLLQPVAVALLAWIFLRSALLTWYRGGIQWRGTFYPLYLLRENVV